MRRVLVTAWDTMLSGDPHHHQNPPHLTIAAHTTPNIFFLDIKWALAKGKQKHVKKSPASRQTLQRRQ